MTDFFTHCCRKYSLLVALLWPLLIVNPSAAADGIEVRNAQLVAGEEGYALEADFGITLNPTLEDVLNKGVALYFLFEFEIIHPRWYWLDQRLVDSRQQYRLSFDALTRQYRIGIGGVSQNFSDLSEALAFLSRVRRREVLESGALDSGSTYTAAVRMRLDTSELPKPFQLDAFGSRDWNVDSGWYRWKIKA
ncbi:MAG TPA: DUF4390 domain-containing protein [Burkholderiales bacterium]|nr:DUF4390 domain-containing protein [Burkholderiales bacterium]